MNSNYHERAKKLIPGGAHTYSKGDDQFPANAPAFIAKGKGCKIFDHDNNEFLDFGMSLGTIILGHAYEPVLDAVKKQLDLGVNFIRPTILEGELAELLTTIIPSAEMVKFGKHGSDATTAAIRLSRAYTGKDYVVRCSNDPFNSIHDWFIGSTVMNSGIPEAIKKLTLTFKYNDLNSLEMLFQQFSNQIACVIFEPVSLIAPNPGFLEGVKSLCQKYNSVLIFDEVVSGFRFSLGGAQEKFNVLPDLSCFGKAMANGFSVSALVGNKEIMKLGGSCTEKERVFLLSTTHGGETHSLAASIKTIQELQRLNAVEHFYYVGKNLIENINSLAQQFGISSLVQATGYSCRPALVFNDFSGITSAQWRTLFLQECVKEKLLIPYIVPSYAHKDEDIKKALTTITSVFETLKLVLKSGEFDKYLVGNTVKPVFRKYN